MAEGAGAVSVSPSLKRRRDQDLDILTPQSPTSHALPSGHSISKIDFKPAASPARSTTSSSGLSDAPYSSGSVSPAVNAFAALNGTAPPLAKKRKLTFQERELESQQKAIEKMEKDQEKEAAKARREADREETKRKAQAEREAKKVKIEAEREERKANIEAEKAAKLEKKKQQEAEKAAKEEEKRKKQRAQKTLNAFFIQNPQSNPKGAVSEKTMGESTPSGTLSKKKDDFSEYEKLFPSFFRHENVTLAPISRWERDNSRIEFVQGTIDKVLQSSDRDDTTNRSAEPKRSLFNPQELFRLPCNDFRQRGRTPKPVREIMVEMHKPDVMSIESQTTQVKRTRKLLSTIPYKFLQFSEDVRPPYRGTFTRPLVPGTSIRLARDPSRRELPEINYDYDSEAEWVDEPGDDLGGEDLDTEGEDDDADGADDMDDFLDNTGQAELDSKHSMTMEPISSGLCWEDRFTRSIKDGEINRQMYRYQMEPICNPEDRASYLPIDPFSTKYWIKELPSPSTASLMNPPRIPLSISKSTNTLTGSSLKTVEWAKVKTKKEGGRPGKEKKLISASEMQRFRDLVQLAEYNEFTKLALIDVLYTKFDKKETKAAVKATLEAVAVHSKEGKWILTEQK